MKYMELINDAEFISVLTKKLAPPLVTLLSSEPEVRILSLFVSSWIFRPGQCLRFIKYIGSIRGFEKYQLDRSKETGNFEA